jgi:DNA repair photolyase
VPVLGWDHPNLKLEKPHIPSNTKVMFPSTHDLTPHNLPLALICMDLILSKGNELLIVTKPRLECINAITSDEKIIYHKDRVEFRFTIGSWAENETMRELWEPNAPSMKERYECVRLALLRGFKISISMEPLLELNLTDLGEAIAYFESNGIDEIWIGAMNYTKNAPKLDYRAIYDLFKYDECVKWKESFRKHLIMKKGDP